MKTCGWCRGPVGDLAIYCSTRCRVAAWRERRRYADVGVTPAIATPVSAPAPLRHRGRNEDLGRETVAALYVRADGPYASMPGVDPWPVERDATKYEGPWPGVYHPDCAPWGRYRNIAPTRKRADLAVRAVDQVRWYGGVLEHPCDSRLWVARDLPRPGETPDQWGGWSMLVRQSWWGHRAPKPTWLYIVGCAPVDIPQLPPPVTDPGGRVENMCHRERELSPPAFAAWLVELARRCRPSLRPRARNASPGPVTSAGASNA